jgi:hypothetical protein
MTAFAETRVLRVEPQALLIRFPASSAVRHGESCG